MSSMSLILSFLLAFHPHRFLMLSMFLVQLNELFRFQTFVVYVCAYTSTQTHTHTRTRVQHAHTHTYTPHFVQRIDQIERKTWNSEFCFKVLRWSFVDFRKRILCVTITRTGRTKTPQHISPAAYRVVFDTWLLGTVSWLSKNKNKISGALYRKTFNFSVLNWFCCCFFFFSFFFFFFLLRRLILFQPSKPSILLLTTFPPPLSNKWSNSLLAHVASTQGRCLPSSGDIDKYVKPWNSKC